MSKLYVSTLMSLEFMLTGIATGPMLLSSGVENRCAVRHHADGRWTAVVGYPARLFLFVSAGDHSPPVRDGELRPRRPSRG